MILPIYAYGQPVLKKVAEPIEPDYPELTELIANMWETMYNADGVGLAAPQIGLAIRLFIIDTEQLEKQKEEEKEETNPGFKKVFINAQILDESGEPWAYEEGCLSIPRVSGGTPLAAALVEMTGKRLGMTAVVDADDRLLGVFTDGDLRRTLDARLDVHSLAIGDVMTRDCVTVPPDMLAAEALNVMQTRKIHALLVVDDERRVVGALNIHDLLRAGVL